MKRVTIVGAGIAGMTAALRLLERGFHVRLDEQDDVVGGLLRSYQDGYGVDLTMSGDVHAGHRALSKQINVVSAIPRLAIYAATTQTWSLFNYADFHASLDRGRRPGQIFQSGDRDPAAPRHTTSDPHVIGTCFHAATLWALGYPDQALVKAQATLDYARTLNDPHSVIYAQVNGICRVADPCGRSDQALEVIAEAVDLAQRHGYEFAYGFAGAGGPGRSIRPHGNCTRRRGWRVGWPAVTRTQWRSPSWPRSTTRSPSAAKRAICAVPKRCL